MVNRHHTYSHRLLVFCGNVNLCSSCPVCMKIQVDGIGIEEGILILHLMLHVPNNKGLGVLMDPNNSRVVRRSRKTE